MAIAAFHDIFACLSVLIVLLLGHTFRFPTHSGFSFTFLPYMIFRFFFDVAFLLKLLYIRLNHNFGYGKVIFMFYSKEFFCFKYKFKITF